MKIHFWKFKPSYTRAVYSDFQRIFKKSRLYKLIKKYPEATKIAIVTVLCLTFLFIQRVYASAPHQEVGIERPEITQIKPLERPKLQKVALVEKKVETPTTAPVQPTGECTGNKYADYIYMKESGCNPAAVNPSGCRGIGQACPGSKLPCEADLACQHKWFEGYAIDRYGSWEAAYNFWIANHWW